MENLRGGELEVMSSEEILEKVKAIKADDTVEDLDDELSHSGSVSIILLFAAILAEAYLPKIILGLISL